MLKNSLSSQLFAVVSIIVVPETMTSFRKAPLNLETWTTLSLNLSARDKLVKIIQYVARILMWYYQRIKADDKVLDTLQKVRDLIALLLQCSWALHNLLLAILEVSTD